MVTYMTAIGTHISENDECYYCCNFKLLLIVTSTLWHLSIKLHTQGAAIHFSDVLFLLFIAAL